MNDQTRVAVETKWVQVQDIKRHPDWPYRKDLGHIDGLCRSMSGKHGQLQPIGIDPGGNLVWGLRRLTAAKKLGWKEILARVVDVAEPLTAMKEENENRINLSPSEMTRIMSCIEASERAKAKARQAAAAPSSGQGAKESGSGNSSLTDPGQARDKAAATFGLSGKTFEAMKAVEEHGTENLREAWNAGEISTHDAAKVVNEPARVQDQAVKAVLDGTANTAAEAAGIEATRPAPTGKAPDEEGRQGFL